MDAMPSYCTFFFQGSALHLFCGTWSGSMHNVYIALKELQTVALMPHNLAFVCLVKLLLYIYSTDKAYLYSQGSIVSLFLSRLACHILNLAEKHSIILVLAYIATHLNLEAFFHMCSLF